LLIALLVFLVIRNNKKKKMTRQEVESAVPEADSKPAVPPHTTELPPNEKKRAAELPPQAMIPVEVPGDQQWPAPTHELEGNTVVGSDTDPSAPT